MTFKPRPLIITNLLVDHVAHGNSDFHASSLNIVEVEMVKESQGNGGQRDASSVAVGIIDCSRVGGVITLKVLDYLPKEHRLNDFDDFLLSTHVKQ